MNPWQIAGVFAAGAAGSVARYGFERVFSGRRFARFPWGILVVNVLGSALLGVVTGAALVGGLDPHWALVLGTGLLGGFTTFSTASLQLATLAGDRRWWSATAYAVGTLVLSTSTAAACLWAVSTALR